MLYAPDDVLRGIAERFRARRLRLAMTQRDLAARSGMSLGSLKRFESTGLVALDSLLRVALVLGCLGDFAQLCQPAPSDLQGRSPDELLKVPRTRRRGRSQ